ncbi:hypothetical protein O181_097549 [Austropuccinia psidii MF-1]|uniref:Uncharacterized protein n=1 Tax=Austropuccinia psidii MF-1 TaxID=1389203 RepID=A0A9Q3J945_9BASI|nr:hypothetical protein [Austropuccinia psidii MF-1]
MSSKLTELTESSPSAPPISVLHGSGILSLFSSPSMASSGHFDPTQTYHGYKAVEVLDPACTEFPISRINTEGIVKRIRQIANSPPDPDAEGSYELDGEEVEVVPNSACHLSNNSPSQPPAKRFQSQVIPSTPRTFQPTLTTIPTYIAPASPHSSHTTTALNSAVRPPPIQQPRNSPIVTSQQLQPVASTSRRREELSPLPFTAAQGFQCRDQRPIQVTREDPNTASDNQDSVARLFRRVDRNSREVIMYANGRTIPGSASEEMAAKFAWYEDDFINYFQKKFDYWVEIISFLFLCVFGLTSIATPITTKIKK